MGNLQKLNPCSHFEWIDVYVDRLEREGIIGQPGIIGSSDLGRGPSAVENLGLGRAVSTRELIGDEEIKGELKKINKQLKKMIDLKKQSNMIAGAFYCFIIALFFFYLQLPSRQN